MNDNLLPCPHCGGKAEYGYDLCIVQCLECGACTDYRDNSDEAVAVWNRRAATEEIEELKRQLISLQNSVLYERRLRSQAEWRAGIVSSDYSPSTPLF